MTKKQDALIGRRVRINADCERDAMGAPTNWAGMEPTILRGEKIGKYYVYHVKLDDSETTLPVTMDQFTVLPEEGQSDHAEPLAKRELVDADPYLVTFSLTNPRRRKGLDIDSLNGLAASIKTQGLAQPILVRPLPGGRAQDTFADREEGRPLPIYELVCGERRLRASRIAGMATIPVLLRDLTDDAALELQLVENIEREDLDAMEEAEGFELLRQKLGYSVEQIAERIGRGKGTSYVYKTMKLLGLEPESRDAMYEGVLGRSTGLLVARYPAAQQADVVAFIKGQAKNGEPAPYRTVAPLVFARFNLELAKAVWAIADATLVAAAGACTSCPKRSGAQADIFGDLEGSPDSCTDPDCFESKRQAHIEQVKQQAAKDGFKVIEGDEAKAAIRTYSTYLNGYRRITDTAYTIEGDDGVEREVTYDDALRAMGKKAPKPRILINPHTGAADKVITEELADTLEEQAPQKPMPAGRAEALVNKLRESDDPRSDEEKALDHDDVQIAVLVRIFDVIRNRPRTADELRLAVKALILGQEGIENMERYLGWSEDINAAEYVEDAEVLVAAKLDAMQADELGQVLAMAAIEISMGAYDSSLTREKQVTLVQSYGIDIVAVRDKVAEDMAAEEARDEEEADA